MFLTKSLEELKTSIDLESPLIKEHDTIKRYMPTRLKLDEDLIKFNKQHTLDVSDLKHIYWRKMEYQLNVWEYIMTDIFLTELNRLGISECVE